MQTIRIPELTYGRLKVAADTHGQQLGDFIDSMLKLWQLASFTSQVRAIQRQTHEKMSDLAIIEGDIKRSLHK
jgi:hypothetical protein